MKKVFLVLIITVIILTGCIAKEAVPLSDSNQNDVCGLGDGCTLAKETFIGYNVGDQMPNIELVDVDGNITNIHDLVKGHDKFILSLSADWCSDCARQNEKLTNYYDSLEEMGYGAAAMYVNYSSSDGTKTTNEQQMIDFINEMNYNFPTYYDKDNNFIDEYGQLYAVPYNFILDENAIIKGITTEIDADILFLTNETKSYI